VLQVRLLYSVSIVFASSHIWFILLGDRYK